MQLSGADLKAPERQSPYDATRVTASVSYFKGDANRSIAWLAAFGQNREVFGTLEAYLIEATQRVRRHAFFMRAESVAKDILDAGFHPIGTAHTHRQSPVSAVTLGYVRDLATPAWGAFGVGGDVTGYLVPDNLSEPYGSPWSFHVFVRYRGKAGKRIKCLEAPTYSAMYNHRSLVEFLFQIVKNGWPGGIFPSGPGLFCTM